MGIETLFLIYCSRCLEDEDYSLTRCGPRRRLPFVFALFFLTPLLFLWPGGASAEGPIIIDHTCTDITKIPSEWLEKAKELTIHYAHTSHGSQIVSGLYNLEEINSIYSVAIRVSETEGLPDAEVPPALRMYDGNPDETYVEPDDYWDGEDGENRTRAVAATGNYDLSMWSWCGQVSWGDENYIQSYLDTLAELEDDYPSMRFIYMTGHLDGTGSSGNLHARNEQIRAFCRANNKILFDFADIERYDPDGQDFLDRGATDACDYDEGNWADEWCAENPGSPLCTCLEDEYSQCQECAHSHWLNCNQKARAFWWMMARLAGWPGASGCANLPARIGGTDYVTFGHAYSGAFSGDHILLQAGQIAGPLKLDRPIVFRLSAGFGCDYSGSPTGVTQLSGHLSIEQGEMQIVAGCLAIGP
jgi:hypothetical protein